MVPTRNLKSALVCAAAVLVGCAGGAIRPTTSEKVQATPERLARGQYLVNTIGACGGCHTGRKGGSMLEPEDMDRHLGGGAWLEDGAVGLWMPNLSSDVETGLGGWSDDEIMRAIRDGIAKDGRILFPIMPYGQYRHLSDEDTRSIVAYLRTVPAVKPVTPKREPQVPFMLSFVVNRGATLHPPAKDVPEPKREDAVAYGRYLAQAGHCMECHSMGGTGPRAETDRYMAGSDQPFALKGVGKVWAPNLTPDPETGLGKYTSEQLERSLRTGLRLDGKPMAPPMSSLMPHYALIEKQDMDALVAWIRALPPIKNQVPKRELEPGFAKLVGE